MPSDQLHIDLGYAKDDESRRVLPPDELRPDTRARWSDLRRKCRVDSSTEVMAERELEETGGPEGAKKGSSTDDAECLRNRKVRLCSDLQRLYGAGARLTSLRVAASIAKEVRIDLIDSTLQCSIARVGGRRREQTEGRWLPVLPAMRGEVYVSLYEWDGGALREIQGRESSLKAQ